MLSKKELEIRIARHLELEAMMKEIEAEQKAIDDSLKKEMERRNIEVLEVGANTVRWTPYVQSRFDSTAFKKAHPEEYAAWQKEVTGHRFSVA